MSVSVKRASDPHWQLPTYNLLRTSSRARGILGPEQGIYCFKPFLRCQESAPSVLDARLLLGLQRRLILVWRSLLGRDSGYL